MELEAIKERFRKERRYGDVRKACKLAGCSDAVYRSAIILDKYEDLTDGQVDVFCKLIDILDERRANRDKIAKHISESLPS
jgi:hypothetical protein